MLLMHKANGALGIRKLFRFVENNNFTSIQ